MPRLLPQDSLYSNPIISFFPDLFDVILKQNSTLILAIFHRTHPYCFLLFFSYLILIINSCLEKLSSVESVERTWSMRKIESNPMNFGE